MSVSKPTDYHRQREVDPNKSDTIASCLTGAGRSAIAVVAVKGPLAGDSIETLFKPATSKLIERGQVRYGIWSAISSSEVGEQTSVESIDHLSCDHELDAGEINSKTENVTSRTDDRGSANESVVVTMVDADHYEVHCHGGTAATERVLSDLQRSGIRRVSQSAWLQGTKPLVVAEAMEVFSRCRTGRTAAIAHRQIHAGIHQWAEQMIDRLKSREATDGLDGCEDELREVRRSAGEMTCFAPVSLTLSDPVSVVLIGPPNVGKSSLINALVGFERSITMDVAGTTRDILHAETVIDGWPIRLSDTAGIRESTDAIEQEGVRRANTAVQQADLVIRVAQPGVQWVPVEWSAATIDVLNKVDLQSEEKLSDDQTQRPDISVSAVHGKQIDLMVERIGDWLTERFQSAQRPIILNDRQLQCVDDLASCENSTEAMEALRRLLHGQKPSYDC